MFGCGTNCVRLPIRQSAFSQHLPTDLRHNHCHWNRRSWRGRNCPTLQYRKTRSVQLPRSSIGLTGSSRFRLAPGSFYKESKCAYVPSYELARYVHSPEGCAASSGRRTKVLEAIGMSDAATGSPSLNRSHQFRLQPPSPSPPSPSFSSPVRTTPFPHSFAAGWRHCSNTPCSRPTCAQKNGPEVSFLGQRKT